MKKALSSLMGLLFLVSCSKSSIEIQPPDKDADNSPIESTSASGKVLPDNNTYTTFTIFKEQHYCNGNLFKTVTLSQLNFKAKFDSSAVYKCVNPVNQYDVNKLYGFSEGFNHQYNSARIGWSWNDGALRLHAYAYNKGVRETVEIAKVPIGTEITCSIALAPNKYLFNVNGYTATLSRAGSSATTSGYRLYPYFGGDEVAPHSIHISISNL